VRGRGDLLLRIRHDLGGEWFLDPWALVVIVPTATLASVATHAGPSVASVLGWMVANAIAFAVCIVLVVVLIAATRERRRRAPLPIAVTLLAGGLLGAVKAAVTDGAGAALGLVSISVGSAAGRIVQVVVLGLGTVPLLVLLRATLARHRTEHRLLVAETLAAVLDPASSGDEGGEARDEVAGVLGELRATLSGASPSVASVLLVEAVEQRLRPLTHRLWGGALAPSSDLTVRGLIAAMLRRPNYPVLVPTSVHLVVVTLFALDVVDAGRALRAGSVAALALAGILQLARLSQPRGGRHTSGLAHLGLVVIAASTVTTLIVAVLLRPELGLALPALVLLMLAWVVPLVLTSGIVATASHDRDAVRGHLALLLGPEWYAQLSRAHVDGAAARDIADRLHGDLQGALLAAAARLRRLSAGSEDARAELERVDALLARMVGPRTASPEPPLGVQLAELRARWRGFLDVRLTAGPRTGPAPDDAVPTFGGRTDRLIAGIVSESLTNAYRHGMARQVHVELKVAHGRVTLSVDDDGTGPLGGRHGIGSGHLDAVAPGAWSRRAREGGGTRLEVVLHTTSGGVAAVPHLGGAL
jgi:hypothetical protein